MRSSPGSICIFELISGANNVIGYKINHIVGSILIFMYIPQGFNHLYGIPLIMEVGSLNTKIGFAGK